MKKHYYLFLLLLSLPFLFNAQNRDYSRYYNSWRLGLNMGGSWQTSDIKNKAGFGGGLTLEKGFFENNTNFFSLAIRGRYLAANTYGYSYKKNYDIKGNDAVNGKYDPAVNYVDTVNPGNSFIYDNYKMTYGEGALELQIGFNRLRARTHVILNLWGGVGITSFKTKSDLLDLTGNKYDFTKVDTGSTTATSNSLKSIYDKKYESYAYGSKGGNIITFSPSCGLGLGYQFAPGFSMIFEYKLTFPQGINADLLDGKIGNNTSWIAGNKDYYHYAGVNFLFTLRGKHHTSSNQQSTTTYSNITTNTVVATPTINTVPNPTVSTTQSVTATYSSSVNTSTTSTVSVTETHTVIPPPVVQFISPSVQNSTVTATPYKVIAQVLNVDNASQIQLKFNAFNQSNFMFNPQTHTLEFMANLIEGMNVVKVKGTNAVGSDSKTVYIEYQKPVQTGNPPQITITNPASNPFLTANNQITVNATVVNVTSGSNIFVWANGTAISGFSYNSANSQLTIPLNLMEGNNVLEIKATNNFGSDDKVTNIQYKKQEKLAPPPVITYVWPSQPSLTSNAKLYNIKANVTNISSQSQAEVFVNGQLTNFNFDPSLHQITLQASLMGGSNQVTINATNAAGSDSKSVVIIYQEPKQPTEPAPIITFVNPATPGLFVSNLNYSFKATVLNVSNPADISVIFNGVQQSGFIFDSNTHELFLNNSTLLQGNNSITINAKNTGGSDSKTSSINYKPKVAVIPPPVVTFIWPSQPSLTTNAKLYNIKANVTNISSQSQAEVFVNGQMVTFNFDPSTLQITLQAPMNLGSNQVTINASNTAGNDSKSVVIIYNEPKLPSIPAPVVTITSPATPNSLVASPAYLFKATVLNVSSSADITVMFNGTMVSNFTFDANTHEVQFNGTLMTGNNDWSVTAKNMSGSDTKSTNIIYKAKVLVQPPVITFIEPNVPGNTVSNSNYIFKANITNISSASQIQAAFNGIQITNFTYNNGVLEYSAVLIQGKNTFGISATNNDGNDTKGTNIICRAKVATPPTVSFIQPVNTPTVTSPVYNVSFKTTNVMSGHINITLNNQPVTNFTFDANTGMGSFNANLSGGENTFQIQVNNADGTDSKTEKVILVKSGKEVGLPTLQPKNQYIPAPAIMWLSPKSSPRTLPDTMYEFIAIIKNVTNASQITAKVNSATTQNFTFDAASGEFKLNTKLVLGDNILNITATNGGGTATDSVNIIQSAPTEPSENNPSGGSNGVKVIIKK